MRLSSWGKQDAEGCSCRVCGSISQHLPLDRPGPGTALGLALLNAAEASLKA